MQRTLLARFFLILGLASVFAFFGVDKLLHPLFWIGWIPSWFEGVFGFARNEWLSVVGVIEMVLALLLLIPKKNIQRAAVILLVLHLLAVLTQTGIFNDIGMRDTGLLFAGIALFFLL